MWPVEWSTLESLCSREGPQVFLPNTAFGFLSLLLTFIPSSEETPWWLLGIKIGKAGVSSGAMISALQPFCEGLKVEKDRFPDSASFHLCEVRESWFPSQHVTLRFFFGLVRRKLRALSSFLLVWVMRQFWIMKLITVIFSVDFNSCDWWLNQI